jgi:hypothetical protein
MQYAMGAVRVGDYGGIMDGRIMDGRIMKGLSNLKDPD